MRFSWATKINLTCREEQFHRHQLHFMMYKQRRKCATYWEDDMTCVSMTVVAGAVAIILCYQRGPELANYLWNLVKTSLTSYHHLGDLTKFMEPISIRNTLQAQLHEALRKAWCFPKRHEPGKIHCATILGWLYYVIFIFVSLFSRGVI